MVRHGSIERIAGPTGSSMPVWDEGHLSLGSFLNGDIFIMLSVSWSTKCINIHGNGGGVWRRWSFFFFPFSLFRNIHDESSGKKGWLQMMEYMKNDKSNGMPGMYDATPKITK